MLVAAVAVGFVLQRGGVAKQDLVKANAAEVPALLPESGLDRFLVNGWLRYELWNLERTNDQSQQRLNASLALLRDDAHQLEYLMPQQGKYEGTRLLDLEPEQFVKVLPLLETQAQDAVLQRKRERGGPPCVAANVRLPRASRGHPFPCWGLHSQSIVTDNGPAADLSQRRVRASATKEKTQ